MSGMSFRIKSFFYRNSRLVNLFCANLLIIICLALLLPRVHESFAVNEEHESDKKPNRASINATKTPWPLLESYFKLDNGTQNREHLHNHTHKLPLGELLICIGFFLFYAIGTFVSIKDEELEECKAGLLRAAAPRRPRRASICSSVMCCTAPLATIDKSPSSTTNQNNAELLAGQSCLLLLNKHHQHPHHHHSTTAQPTPSTSYHQSGPKSKQYRKTNATTNKTYGTVQTQGHDSSSSRAFVEDGIDILGQSSTTIIDDSRIVYLNWPTLTMKTTLGSLMIGLLLFTVPNFQGAALAVKVFRAIITGALLYIAFFVLLPSPDAVDDCEDCEDDDILVEN